MIRFVRKQQVVGSIPATGSSFFISTGEVLLPQLTVGGKASGQAKLEAGLTWTFPMAFAEVVTGDGEKVYRQQIYFYCTGPFGKQTLSETLYLSRKRWVRIEAWDVTANGSSPSQSGWINSSAWPSAAFFQPMMVGDSRPYLFEVRYSRRRLAKRASTGEFFRRCRCRRIELACESLQECHDV